MMLTDCVRLQAMEKDDGNMIADVGKLLRPLGEEAGACCLLGFHGHHV
jgi:hypothetical protein